MEVELQIAGVNEKIKSNYKKMACKKNRRQLSRQNISRQIIGRKFL